MGYSITRDTINKIEHDAKSATEALASSYGFLPAKLWSRIERARAALHLLSLEAEATRLTIIAENLNEQTS